MKKPTCHCGDVEAKINTFELKNVIVNYGQNNPLDQKNN